jgi:hypothetical protein
MHDDERAATAADVLHRAAWFAARGVTARRVLIDNGGSYRSRDWAAACAYLGITPSGPLEGFAKATIPTQHVRSAGGSHERSELVNGGITRRGTERLYRVPNMTMAEALVGAGGGLIAGLVPFAYTVRKGRRERIERAQADALRQKAEEQRELRAAATRYMDLLGKAMALLEAVLVDADNADELLRGATNAQADLQGHAQSSLFVGFQKSPPVIWSDRVCRTVLKKGLTLAENARAKRQTGEAARETQRAIRELTMNQMDVLGPRHLFRWASDEACKRWPEPLTSFEEESWAAADAKRIATELDFEPPP